MDLASAHLGPRRQLSHAQASSSGRPAASWLFAPRRAGGTRPPSWRVGVRRTADMPSRLSEDEIEQLVLRLHEVQVSPGRNTPVLRAGPAPLMNVTLPNVVMTSNST